MNSRHEVISAFLDDEPFDPQELANTLGDPTGRTLLIDLIALRRIVQPTDAAPAIIAANPVRRRPWQLAAAAAALFFALAGGYLIGERRAMATSSEAPPPTRIVEAVPFVPAGGMR
jgi:hypothetical protein